MRVALGFVMALKYGVISRVLYPRVSCFSFDTLHKLEIRIIVDIIQYANGVSSNMTGSDRDFFVPWHSISIFRDIILTFPVDVINFARTHIIFLLLQLLYFR